MQILSVYLAGLEVSGMAGLIIITSTSRRCHQEGFRGEWRKPAIFGRRDGLQVCNTDEEGSYNCRDKLLLEDAFE